MKKQNVFKTNRAKLMNRIKDGLIVMKASDHVLRNGDVEHHFRQNSPFLYLTGITEPGSVLIIDSKNKKSHLFIPDVSELHLIWIGRQLEKPDAKRKFGVDCVYFISELEAILKKMARGNKKIHAYKNTKAFITKLVPKTEIDTSLLPVALNNLRLFKEPYEIACMRKANQISHQSHVAAMQIVKSCKSEFQVQAELVNVFLRNGAFHWAYYPIVASGKNAAILHYHENTASLKSTDLLLIDAGCEWQGYASDVTRTFPISGKFSKKQKDIYELVLETQKECIKLARPGVSLISIHEHSCRIILQGLLKLGVLKKFSVDELYAKNIHRIFYPHGIGHLIGLDVHDVGAKPQTGKMKGLRSAVILEPGMAITVEPGIYFIDAYFNSKKRRAKYARYVNWKTASAYRQVGGIRIEDDIVITKTGALNLTTTPKEIAEIERIMRR